MSEKTNKTPNKKTKYMRRRVTALGAAGLAALGVAEGVNALGSHPAQPSDSVKEYMVEPGDTVWTVANRAFPDEAGNAEKMYEVRQEIEDQLPKDDSHRDGMLQPGDNLVFGDSAQIGDEMKWAEAEKDMSGRAVSGFYNSYRGKDGKVRMYYDKDRTIVLSQPIR